MLSKSGVSDTCWALNKKLGSGGFGNVWLWKNLETGQSLAAKICTLDQHKLQADELNKLKLRWRQESEWMQEIDNDNIVRALPHHDYTDLVKLIGISGDLPVILLEYCDGGNLRDKLASATNAFGFAEYDAREVLKALGNAIMCLHIRFGITHRDIKPENIVIKNVDGRPVYKLTDLGYARHIDRDTVKASIVGSQTYFAPEIIFDGEYKNTVDYWSMGIVAFEIMCGTYPFQGTTTFEMLKIVKQMPPRSIAFSKSKDNIIFYNTLFQPNRLSPVFRKLIEPWLQLALAVDGRKRGYITSDVSPASQEPELVFYKVLSAALNTKILTIFWLNRCKFIYFNVNDLLTTKIFWDFLERETGMKTEDLFLVLPSKHPLKSLNSDWTPYQLYDERFAYEDWSMLYVVDCKTDGTLHPDEPGNTEMLRSMCDPTQSRQIQWDVRLRNILFLYHSEHRKINEFVRGVQEFVISVEDEIIYETENVKEFHQNLIYFKGLVAHFEAMVAMGGLAMRANRVPDCEALCNEYDLCISNLKAPFAENRCLADAKVQLHNVQLLMQQNPFEKHLEKINDLVTQFQNSFVQIYQQSSIDCVTKYIFDLIKATKEFYMMASRELNKPNSVVFTHQNIRALVRKVETTKNHLNSAHTLAREKSKDYMEKLTHLCCNKEKALQTKHFEQMIERMDTFDLTDRTSANDQLILTTSTDQLINYSQMLSRQ